MYIYTYIYIYIFIYTHVNTNTNINTHVCNIQPASDLNILFVCCCLMFVICVQTHIKITYNNKSQIKIYNIIYFKNKTNTNQIKHIRHPNS